MSSNFANFTASLILLGIVFAKTNAWTGHVCTNTVSQKQTSLQCVRYSTRCTPIQADYRCCEWRNITSYDVIDQQKCCTGWTESQPGNQQCTKSICSGCTYRQVCTSNGTCERECSASGNSYPPCYPGSCGSGHCTCADGFHGQNCFYISAKASTVNVKLRLSRKIKPENKTIFSSETCINYDTVWTNMYGFNDIQLDWDVICPLNDLPPMPSSLNTTSFYLRYPKATLSASKDNQSASYYSQYHYCRGHDSNQRHVKCSASYLDFDRDVGHGDRFQIKLETQLRGSFTLKSNGIRRQYSSSTTTVSYTVGFDFDPPAHNDSTNMPLVIQTEFSKHPITISWNGWMDSMSGIDRFYLDVYLLSEDENGTLRQPQRSSASYSFNNTITSMKYTPKVAGVYSYILKIVDKAGNFEFARRYGIYDPHSSIEMSKQRKMFVASATEDSGYRWQNNTKGIIVNFKDHFFNRVQDSGGFLHRISAEPDRGFFSFSVKRKYDDPHLAKNIQNVRGIVLFQYIGQKIKENHIFSEKDWKNVSDSQMLSDSFLISDGNKDGDSYTIWVRAHDVMGNMATDNVTVFFDTTNPNYSLKRKIIISKNVDGKYRTSVGLRVYDRDSGILKIAWEVIDKENRSVLSTGSITGNKTSEAVCNGLPGDCDCIYEGSCFYYDHIFFINHCHILLPTNLLSTTKLDLRIIAFNGASLTRENITYIGPVTDLKGIKTYPQPEGVRVNSVSQSGVRIDWQYASSCYNPTSIYVWYKAPSGERTKLNLPKNATSLSVEGLSPGETYTFEFLVTYGDQTSDLLEYPVTTAGDTLPVSYVAGLVLEGIAIFVLLIAWIYCYFRRKSSSVGSFHNLESSVQMSDLKGGSQRRSKRRLPDPVVEFEPDNKPTSLSNTRERQSQPAGSTQTTYDDTLCVEVDTEDNVYEDLSDALPSRQKTISREMIKLNSMVHEGHFGTIYSGLLCSNTQAELSIAIRCPNVTDTSETAVQEFETKIKEILSGSLSVGRHENLLRYVDVVVDGEDPPMLLMELCLLGCLRTWLDEQHESLRQREDLTIILHDIGLGVARGMEYLEEREMWHGGLNSYEILLSKHLVPKIKNYVGVGNERNNNFLKWTAPEVLQTQQSSILADVWSYGVVLWELLQMDRLPYSDVTDDQYLEYLNDGKRMGNPDICEERHAVVLDQAWQLDPQDRPAFRDIVTTLTDDVTGSGVYSNERGSLLQTFS